VPPKPFRTLIRQDMAVDLGTANTLVYRQGEGVVLNEPTVIALSNEDKVVEVGRGAKRFLGRTPSGIRALRPMKDGVIADFNAMSALIQVFLDRARGRRGILAPRVVICVPSHITQVEKRAVLDAARDAGATKIFLLEEVMAAAIGAGLPVHGRQPHMIVDIGGGTTEAAVIAEWAYLHCETLRVAGDEMDEAIAHWLVRTHGLELGLASAEDVKWRVGSAWEVPGEEVLQCKVAGKDRLSGIPRGLNVTSLDMRQALKGPLDVLSRFVQGFLGAVPPDVREGIEAGGVTLTGGGSLLRGLAAHFSHQTGIPFSVTRDPLTTVVHGAGRTIEDFDQYRKVFIN